MGLDDVQSGSTPQPSSHHILADAPSGWERSMEPQKWAVKIAVMLTTNVLVSACVPHACGRGPGVGQAALYPRHISHPKGTFLPNSPPTPPCKDTSKEGETDEPGFLSRKHPATAWFLLAANAFPIDNTVSLQW